MNISVSARIYWDGEALSRIPPYVQAASKQGALDRSRSGWKPAKMS